MNWFDIVAILIIVAIAWLVTASVGAGPSFDFTHPDAPNRTRASTPVTIKANHLRIIRLLDTDVESQLMST